VVVVAATTAATTAAITADTPPANMSDDIANTDISDSVAAILLPLHYCYTLPYEADAAMSGCVKRQRTSRQARARPSGTETHDGCDEHTCPADAAKSGRIISRDKRTHDCYKFGTTTVITLATIAVATATTATTAIAGMLLPLLPPLLPPLLL